MKNIFKKITAVAASALMVVLPMGIAAATTYPAPFVEGSTASVAIVYGTGTGVLVSDFTQAGTIEADLASSLITTGGIPSGDNILLERDKDKFNLQNNMSAFYSKLDHDELTTILAKGVYTNDVHDDFKYEQEIVLAPGNQLTHFLDSKFNDDKPVIGFDLSSNTHLLNYTLSFTPDFAEGTVSGTWTGITDSELFLFGKAYYVLSMTNTSNTDHKITLLNAAVSSTLNQGESATLTTSDGSSYTISITYIDGTNVKLTINGELTDSLVEGETQKLSDGSYVGIKEVASQQYSGGTSYTSFSIGSGKLVLENTKEVEINSEKLSKTDYPIVGSDETISYKVTSYITTSGTKIDKIVLDWETDDEGWIAPGTEMIIPGFETVKLSMNEFVTSVGEVTTFEGDSSKFEITTVITDGALTLPIFYMNTSATGIAELGKDATHVLATGNGSAGGIGAAKGIMLALNQSVNSYFVVSWIDGDDSECYAYELESVDEDSKNKTVLTNLVTKGELSLSEEGDWEDDGQVRFTLDFAEEEYKTHEYVILNISAASTGAVYTNRLVTADGLMMTLPVEWSNASLGYTRGMGGISASVTNGFINNTDGNQTTWTMNVTEEDKNDNIGYGKSVEIVFTTTGVDGLEPASVAKALTSTTMRETAESSRLYEGYVPSDLSTKFLHYKPTSGANDLEVTYFGTETYAEVFITEATSVMSGGTSLGSVIVMDTDVSTVSSTKNLIVVGGSCINSAAATLLGIGAACESDFTDATEVGTGQFLIQSFGDAYVTGKIALLVAGYDAADTISAVTYLKTQTVDTTAGKKYIGTDSSTATLQVS